MVKKVFVSINLFLLISLLSVSKSYGMSRFWGSSTPPATPATSSQSSEIVPSSEKSLVPGTAMGDSVIFVDSSFLDEKLEIATRANGQAIQIIQKLEREKQDPAYQKLLVSISDSPEHLLHLTMAPWKTDKAVSTTRLESATAAYVQSMQKAIQQAHRVEKAENQEDKHIIDLRPIEDTVCEALEPQIVEKIKKEQQIKKERWINRHPIKFAASSVGVTLAILAIFGSQQK